MSIENKRNNRIIMKPKKVKAPEGCMSYLTGGKEYNVTGIWGEDSDIDGYGFYIVDDHGNIITTKEKISSHLGMQDWIITETE